MIITTLEYKSGCFQSMYANLFHILIRQHELNIST